MSKHTTASLIPTASAEPELLLKSKVIATRLNCTTRNIELLADRGIIRRIVLGPRCHRFLWSNVAESLGI